MQRGSTPAADRGAADASSVEDALQHSRVGPAAPEAAEFHPIANLFPLMSEEELDKLANDITCNGVQVPIWRHRDGRIIDGRNRFLACQKAGVECPSKIYSGDLSLASFVVALNLQRRHLTTDQRAAIAAELANLNRGQKKADASIDVSQPEAAKLLKVGVASVQRAAAVKAAAPELHEEVKAGAMKAGAARAKVRQRAGDGTARAKVVASKPKPPSPAAPRSDTSDLQEQRARNALPEVEANETGRKLEVVDLTPAPSPPEETDEQIEARLDAAFDAYLARFGSAAGSARALRLEERACKWQPVTGAAP